MGQFRILIVEDEEIARLLYKRLLDRLPYRYDMAETLAEARELLAKADRYDLLVTDIRLPDGRGTDLLDGFHRRFPEARMLIITGSPDLSPHSSDPPLLKGVEKIFKPFEVDEFIGMIEHLLKR